MVINMNYEADVYWNKGVLHDVNQDSLILIQTLTAQGRVLMAVICDGMGGMDSGETASGYLAEELVTWYYDGLLAAIAKKKPLWVISRSARRKVYQVQSKLKRYADKRSLEMGTTMSMLILWEKKYLIWHLGDSRIYCLRKRMKGRIQLMTKDHADNQGRLVKCVGSFGHFIPDFRMGTAGKNVAFLVCSDGFYNKVKDEELAEALGVENMSQDNIRRRLRTIGETVVRRGGGDDLSAVYVKVCK